MSRTLLKLAVAFCDKNRKDTPMHQVFLPVVLIRPSNLRMCLSYVPAKGNGGDLDYYTYGCCYTDFCPHTVRQSMITGLDSDTPAYGIGYFPCSICSSQNMVQQAFQLFRCRCRWHCYYCSSFYIHAYRPQTKPAGISGNITSIIMTTVTVLHSLLSLTT